MRDSREGNKWQHARYRRHLVRVTYHRSKLRHPIALQIVTRMDTATAAEHEMQIESLGSQ